MPPADVLKKLRAADWEQLYPALVAYAVVRTRRLPFVKGGTLPQGHEPPDVAREAIRLVFEGERRWDPEKDPDLLRYLSGVVSSLVSNLVTSADHVSRHVGSPTEPAALDRFSGGRALDPADALASDECVEELRAIVDRETAGDDGLATVQMGFEDGMSRGEIAELLSIDVNEVYTLTRKLRRRLLSAMAEHECWEGHPLFEGSAISQR